MDEAEFAQFWEAYPLKVSKQQAIKAFAKAIKATTIAAIIAGLDQYKRTKPDWQHWAYPASWLNAGRWEDAPLTEPPAPAFVASPRKPFIPKPDISPEERKRVGTRMIALGKSLDAVMQQARAKANEERRARLRQRADTIIAADPRPLAERLGLWTAGDAQEARDD